MPTLYIDTNIYLDVLLDRKNIYNKDIADPAMKIFYRAAKCEFNIVFSSWSSLELSRQIEPGSTTMLFSLIQKKIKFIEHTKEDIEKAKTINPLHFQDALHGILAKKAKADLLVTRDLKGFECVKHLIKTSLPENV